MDLKGKSALVTGASRGIGRAIAEALAREGVHVYGGARAGVIDGCHAGVTPVQFDVSSPETAEESWRAAGLDSAGISILVNNAGSGVAGAFERTDFEAWRGQVELMLLAPMRLAQLAAEGWKPANPGVLVNVGSMAADFPIPFMAGYNAAKAGLATFSESLALEAATGELNARVIELRLGDFRTRFRVESAAGAEPENVRSALDAMFRHMAKGPKPEVAAEVLLNALRRDRVGVVRAGTFFQCVLASLFGRFATQRMRRQSNLAYYNLNQK